ncbi:MAG: hypothetical protein JEZ00_04465 [Anaerolineaceae bacterium]|nr:hypothetical protein [Anaerolineaceae bacterium]
MLNHATINTMDTESHGKPIKRPSTLKHNKQSFWQIFFPMIIFILIILALCILIVMNASSDTGQNQHFANISTMYLLIPPLLFTLPIIGILIALIYFISKIFPYITKYGALIQEKLAMVREMLTKGMDTVSQPFISLPAYYSSAKTLISEIQKGLRRFTHYE